MTKKVCIIGAGVSGLTCLKECQDVGFTAVCYEQSDYTGGLWRFRHEVTAAASVAKSTTCNTSKEMNAFSDFPPPKELPNYCHNRDLVKYFDAYVERNNLLPLIKLRHRVTEVKPSPTYTKDGTWVVRVTDLAANQEGHDTFDAVFLCNGHHSKPHMPTFPGQERFKSHILHSHDYRTPEPFKGKKVTVIGIGNSAADAAVELSTVTDKCYLSTRRGAWISHRLGPFGIPSDMAFLRRWVSLVLRLLPVSVVCSMFESRLNCKFDHKLYGLKPKHRIFQQYPTTNDLLPNKIITGEVVVKKDIQELTRNGIIFEGDVDETPLDVVLLATGYEMSFPFLGADILPGYPLGLYKYMLLSHLDHPETLVFIGLVEPVGSHFPVGEMQSRWAIRILMGEISLPSKELMIREVQKQKQRMESLLGRVNSPRHVTLVDYIPYMDDLSSELGVKPNLFKYFVTDPVLWYHLFFGPAVSYQYRLEGVGKWEGAREAILTVSDRFEGAFNGTRHEDDSSVNERIADSLGLILSFTPYLLREIKWIFIFTIVAIIVKVFIF